MSGCVWTVSRAVTCDRECDCCLLLWHVVLRSRRTQWCYVERECASQLQLISRSRLRAVQCQRTSLFHYGRDVASQRDPQTDFIEWRCNNGLAESQTQPAVLTRGQHQRLTYRDTTAVSFLRQWRQRRRLCLPCASFTTTDGHDTVVWVLLARRRWRRVYVADNVDLAVQRRPTHRVTTSTPRDRGWDEMALVAVVSTEPKDGASQEEQWNNVLLNLREKPHLNVGPPPSILSLPWRTAAKFAGICACALAIDPYVL